MQKAPFIIHSLHMMLVMILISVLNLVCISTPLSFLFCFSMMMTQVFIILCSSAMGFFNPKFRILCLCLLKFILWDFTHSFRLFEFFGIWFYPSSADFPISCVSGYSPIWLTYLFCFFSVSKTVVAFFSPLVFLSGRCHLVFLWWICIAKHAPQTIQRHTFAEPLGNRSVPESCWTLRSFIASFLWHLLILIIHSFGILKPILLCFHLSLNFSVCVWKACKSQGLWLSCLVCNMTLGPISKAEVLTGGWFLGLSFPTAWWEIWIIRELSLVLCGVLRSFRWYCRRWGGWIPMLSAFPSSFSIGSVLLLSYILKFYFGFCLKKVLRGHWVVLMVYIWVSLIPWA